MRLAACMKPCQLSVIGSFCAVHADALLCGQFLGGSRERTGPVSVSSSETSHDQHVEVVVQFCGLSEFGQSRDRVFWLKQVFVFVSINKIISAGHDYLLVSHAVILHRLIDYVPFFCLLSQRHRL